MASENIRGWVQVALSAIIAGTAAFWWAGGVEHRSTAAHALGERNQSRLDAFDAKLSGFAESIAGMVTHIEEHERSSADWKPRIVANELGIRELVNNANARKDPFTGTEGKEHERRIDALERAAVEAGRMKDDIDRLRQQVDADRAYYRQSVVPLLEQSNMLQLQRSKQ